MKKIYKRLLIFLIGIYFVFTLLNQQSILNEYSQESEKLSQQLEEEKQQKQEKMEEEKKDNKTSINDLFEEDSSTKQETNLDLDYDELDDDEFFDDFFDN